MRQLILHGPDNAEWVEAPEPKLLEPTDVLVRPLAVAACDLDVAAVRGAVSLGTDYPLGHEFVGEIAEVGNDVTRWTPGHRVIVPFQISCGTCGTCIRGNTGNCESVPRLSMYGFADIGGREWGGAWADLVRVPFADNMLVLLPDGVPVPAAANISDNLTDAWRSVAPYLEAEPHRDVLVFGGGGPSIGLWAAEFAVALGACEVDYVDDDETRLRHAENAGANALADPLEHARTRRSLVIEVTGDPNILRTAVRATAPDGICVSTAPYWGDAELPLLDMYSKNVTFVTGRPHSRAQLPHVLELVGQGAIDPLRIATIVSWDDLPDAFSDAPPKLVTIPL